MVQRHLAGLQEDALHGAPPVVLVSSTHAVHLLLAADGVAVLLPGHTQEDVGAHVFEAHILLALPVDAITLDRPHVQIVSLAVLSKSADLLQATQWEGKTRTIQLVNKVLNNTCIHNLRDLLL